MLTLREIVAMQNLSLLGEYSHGFTWDEVREHGRLLRVDIERLEAMILALEARK
jgi:uncharacterized protein (DUF2249 family)